MKEMILKAPAKVNTLLRVVGLRDDGYHDLEMVMVPLSLCDEIALTEIPAGIELVVDGTQDAGMAAEKNLAWRAARALLDATGAKRGVRIELTKNIPVAAGLGGGSSDAAAVMKGLNRLWGLDLPVDKLCTIGGRLGADVPFFCHARPAYVEGMGERVSVYESFPKLALLLINPGFAVSTPWVYKQWDLQLTHNTPGATVRPLFQVVSDVVVSLHNDLERVTIPAHPEIAVIKDALTDVGASGVLMSGSGPTVFGIFKDGRARDEASTRLGDRKWRIISADSVSSAGEL